MDDSTKTSVVLSNKKIDKINADICKNINPRLYLAAHYAPKEHPESDAYEGIFWCAVTNAYCLFMDCMPPLYRKNNCDGLLDIFCQSNLLSYPMRQEISDCYNTVNDLRSVYCHNLNPRIYGDSKEKIERVYAFFETIGDKNTYDTEDLFSIPNFSTEQWKYCFESFSSIVDKCIDSLYYVILESARINKTSEILPKWENLLASWLASGKYEYTTVRDELIAKTINLPHSKKPIINGPKVKAAIKQIRYRVLSGENKNKEFEIMTDTYMKIITTLQSPALPDVVTKQLFSIYYN